MPLDWSNERYIRLYTRETPDQAVWCWQALALWPWLLARADRAGVIETRKGLRGLAALTRMPLELVEAGMVDLLDDGCIVARPSGYVIPNYVTAQTAVASANKRKADERARERADASLSCEVDDESVTRGHAESRDVTAGHAESRNVTPSGTERDRSEPSGTEAREAASPPRARAIPVTDTAPEPCTDRDTKPAKAPRAKLVVSPHLPAAERLWGLQDRLRAEVMPRSRRLEPTSTDLGRVIRALESGRSEELLEQVLNARAEAVRRDATQGRWFDGVSNWRPDNLARDIGQLGTAADPTADELGAARSVLTQLGGKLRIDWTGDKHAIRAVVAALRAEHTGDELWLIARYCGSPTSAGGLGWFDDERMRKHLNPSTLFSEASVGKYLTAARAWAGKARAP